MNDYFHGFEATKLHPHMPATGTEGRCELCGGPEEADLHVIYEERQREAKN